MLEFTFKRYKELILSFLESGYKIQTVQDYIEAPEERVLILRHDVDREPKTALKMAELENSLGVRSTYFFRILPNVYKKHIMKDIIKLGHEVSYHYEDLSIKKGNYNEAIKHFEYHLNNFREFVPAKTICMHGSPYSKWNNIKLWEKFDYKKYGIIADTTFDIDYD